VSDIIRDIFQGLKDTFETAFTGVATVKLGYMDERSENENNISYPVVLISMYDVDIANNKMYSGMTRIVQNENQEAGTAETVGLPIPINFHFQIDTESEKREVDWDMMEIMLPILGRNSKKIITNAGRTIYLVPESFEALDKLRGSLWSKSYRFYVRAWMDHPDAAQSVYLVLKRRFDIGPDIDFNFRPDE